MNIVGKRSLDGEYWKNKCIWEKYSEEKISSIFASDGSQSTREFIQDRQKENPCEETGDIVVLLQSKWKDDKGDLHIRITYIERSIQESQPEQIRQHILLMTHYPSVAGHSVERRMYDMVRRVFYWLMNARGALSSVEKCNECHIRGTRYNH